MELNFVDPPIPADWWKFEPNVSPERAPDALARAATAMRSNEVLNAFLRDDQIEPLAAALEDPAVVDVYATGVPMVARFLTIELGTAPEIDKGVGRVTPSDPPPRFGAKYSKQLKDQAVATRFGAVIEDLALHGFAAAATRNAALDDPKGFADRALPERWTLLVRNLSMTWHDLTDQIQLDPKSVDPLPRWAGSGRSASRGAATYLSFFLAVGFLVFDSGTDHPAGARS